MTENLYEGMFLLDSGRFASDPDGMSQSVVDILEKSGATVVAHRPWQDGKLAYEVEGRRRGLHYLTYFRMDTSRVKDLERACKLSDMVLRHMVIRQDPKLFDAMVAALTGHDYVGEGGEKPATAAAPAAVAVAEEESDESDGGEEE